MHAHLTITDAKRISTSVRCWTDSITDETRYSKDFNFGGLMVCVIAPADSEMAEQFRAELESQP